MSKVYTTRFTQKKKIFTQEFQSKFLFWGNKKELMGGVQAREEVGL